MRRATHGFLVAAVAAAPSKDARGAAADTLLPPRKLDAGDVGAGAGPRTAVEPRRGERSPPSAKIALLFVGPHKTGSTTLQGVLRAKMHALAADGVCVLCEEDRWSMDHRKPACTSHGLAFHLQGVNFSYHAEVKWWPFFQAHVRNAAAKGDHILLSSEELDKPAVDLPQLVSALPGYELRVLAVHRRFFKWMRSVHDEETQRRGALEGSLDIFSQNLARAASQFTPMVDWLTEATIVGAAAQHTAALRARYGSKGALAFLDMESSDISNDKDALPRGVFCSDFVPTPRTCKALRKFSAPQVNPSGDSKAIEVTLAAFHAGWLRGTETLGNVVEWLSPFLDPHSLPLRCPSAHVLQLLRNETLTAEQAMLSAHVLSEAVPDRVKAAEREFQSAARWDLCSVDGPALLKNETWRGIFRQGGCHARGCNGNHALLDAAGKVLMGWSPRAACTLAVSVFVDQIGRLKEAQMYQSKDQGVPIHRFRIEALGSDYRPREQDFADRSLTKFKIVRNPFDRATSSYSHQMSTLFSGGGPGARLMADALGIYRYSRVGPVSFIRWLRAVQKVTLARLDQHSKLQVAVGECDGSVIYDRICKLEEDLGACLDGVNQLAGTHFRVSDSATSSAEPHNAERVDMGGAVAGRAWASFERANRSDRVPVLPKPADFYRGALGAEAASIVRTLYRYDFEMYGYDPYAVEGPSPQI